MNEIDCLERHFLLSNALMMYWAASTVPLSAGEARLVSLASMSLQLARRGQVNPLDMKRQLPKMQPRGDRSISQMLWIKWYLLSSCRIANWNSHTASLTLIFSTTSVVCGFDSLLSSYRISYPRKWHSLSQASTAFPKSSMVSNIILPRRKSLISQVVSICCFPLSARISVISLVHTSMISWTTLSRVTVLPFLRNSASILLMMDFTRCSLISFLNIFSRMRRMTLNCWAVSLGSFMFTPQGMPLERIRTASTNSLNSGRDSSACLLTLSISLYSASQLLKKVMSLKRLTLKELGGLKFFIVMLREQACPWLLSGDSLLEMALMMACSLASMSRMGCFQMRLLFQKCWMNSCGMMWKYSSSSWKMCFTSSNTRSMFSSANLSQYTMFTICSTSLLRALASLTEREASPVYSLLKLDSKDLMRDFSVSFSQVSMEPVLRHFSPSLSNLSRLSLRKVLLPSLRLLLSVGSSSLARLKVLKASWYFSSFKRQMAMLAQAIVKFDRSSTALRKHSMALLYSFRFWQILPRLQQAQLYLGLASMAFLYHVMASSTRD